MSHKKSMQYETADSLTFVVSQFSSPTTPRKLLSEKKRDSVNPDILWRLKVYPNGNGTAGFLALYVDIPSKHSLPEDWSCSRDITFTLHHPTDPSKTIFKRTSHTFNDEEPDWGYNQVIPIPALFQRGFLQNDSIKVTATFRVPDNSETTPVSASGTVPQPSLTPQTPLTPVDAELTAPRSPSLSVAVPHEYNDHEDCRIIIEEFSKAGYNPRACDWRSFSGESLFEWRLVVFPNSGSETVSAYIDVRAKDVKNDKWEQTVSAEVFLDSLDNSPHSLRYPFVKVFKASKPRKGFPILSLTPILLKDGFLANDKLCVSAKAKLVDNSDHQKVKKVPAITDALVMQVHGFLSYDGSSNDTCKIVSPWHKLEGVGRWRISLYPAGIRGNTGYVSAVVSFQPGEELSNSNEAWQIRVLCEAKALRKGEKQEENEGDACVTVLDAEHMKVSLDRVISTQKVIEQKDQYLKWNPDFEDDDTLRIRVLFRTCAPSGPKTFIAKQTMDACLKGVEGGMDKVKETLALINKPLLADSHLAAVSWDLGMKQLEEVFKKQSDILSSLGSELEHQDRIDFLNRKLASLKEEEEVCAGKGCPVEELNAKEQGMRSTLKKLLLLQTTGCEGNTPAKEASKEEKTVSTTAEPVGDVPKPSVTADEVMTRNTSLITSVYSLIEQCERVGALSDTLCKIHDGLEHYMTQMAEWITEQTKKYEEFVAKEKELEAQCQEAERKNQILRGDEGVLKTLTMDEVTRYVDFVMEAVGQVAVAKYLTKK